MLTTWFTPRQGVAVNRMHAFVKYLDPAKYEITVITVQPDNRAPESEMLFGAHVYRVKNKSLFKRINERAGEPKMLHYAKVTWNVLLSFARKLEYSDWMRGTGALLEEIHAKNRIHAIISSYSPVEAHLAAFAFCRKHTDVKWIADMRDEMSGNPHLPKKETRLLARVERQLAQKADAVTSVSLPILADFQKLMPEVKYFEEVRNGYDHEVEPSVHFNPVFTIAYAGSFYGLSKPQTFFEALKNFVARQNCSVRLQFIGVHRNFSIPAEFETSCEFIPPLSYPETVSLLAKADANLLILAPVQRKGVYSGKLFDYLSVQKPVIGLLDTTDVAAQLITGLNAGFVAAFTDITAIEKAIAGAYELWKSQTVLQMDREKIKLLHRRYEVAKLERLTDKLLAS